jgi:hypothetical protein
MAARKGNSYWKLAKGFGVGAEKKYTPEELWATAVEYFHWVEGHPLYEEEVFGTGKSMMVARMRAMTVIGFCLYAHIGRRTYDGYCADEAYLPITTRIRDVIYTQKFEGAAAGLLQPNIIARELGLREHTDHTTGEKPIEFSGFNFLPLTPEADGT